MNKLVTIIIPTIGRGELLKAAILSAVSQTYKKIEIFVSDNNSNSNVEKIIEDINDKRIRLVTRESRLDLASHIRICYQEALGEYIMILSDDDLISRDYIEGIVKVFDNDSSIGLGISSQVILGPNDLELNEEGPRAKNSIIDGWIFLQKFILGQIPISVYTFFSLFTRRDSLYLNDFYKEFWPGSNGSHVDNYLLFLIAINSKVAITQGLFGYRVYPQSEGLTTRFIALTLATKRYGMELSRLINLKTPFFSKKYFIYTELLKYSLVDMLFTRLNKYYRKRESFKNYVKYFLLVVYCYPVISIYYILFSKSVKASSFMTKVRSYLLN